jgi:hypothetical protein
LIGELARHQGDQQGLVRRSRQLHHPQKPSLQRNVVENHLVQRRMTRKLKPTLLQRKARKSLLRKNRKVIQLTLITILMIKQRMMVLRKLSKVMLKVNLFKKL